MTHALTKPTANSPAVSVRERSTADLTQAIHSPGDEAYVLNRTRVVLSAFFQADMDHQQRADLIDEFGRALRELPRWAVVRGFDAWMRTGTHRPTPANIVILAQRELEVLTDEVARRARLEKDAEEAQAWNRLQRCSAESAERALQAAGFTPRRIDALEAHPMASTFAEAEALLNKPAEPHWTERAPADSPALAQLRASRDANRLVQDARRAGGVA